jgi:DNA polymerase-4
MAANVTRPANPVTALCRDCASESDGGPERSVCPACGGARLVRHPALGTLAVAHLDCDAFYAAVEKRDDPALADKPVLVGGGRRGVVMACCYIARRYGIHSAMPMYKAREACPDAVVIQPDMEKYSTVGRAVRQLMLETTPLVEPLSIDEAFLDLSGTEAVHGGSPARTLARLALRIEDEIDITVSVGLSYNKFLAKIASDLDKPRGFAVIGRAEAQDFLAERPVGLLWGVGEALERRLHRDGLRTIGALRVVSETELVRRYGAIGERLARFARGEDDRRVKPGRAAKSVSGETTFERDIRDVAELKAHLWRQCERVARRLRRADLAGRVATLKLKTADFTLITRSRRLGVPTQLAEALFEVLAPLLEREARGRRFRLIGAGMSELSRGSEAEPRDLFDDGRRRAARLEQTLDELRVRYGEQAPVKGRGLGPGGIARRR